MGADPDSSQDRARAVPDLIREIEAKINALDTSVREHVGIEVSLDIWKSWVPRPEATCVLPGTFSGVPVMVRFDDPGFTYAFFDRRHLRPADGAGN